MSPDEIERVLLDESAIRERVAEMAVEIDRSFGGEAILAVGVLNGAFVFLADLVRQISSPVEVAFLRAASYGDGTRPGTLCVETVGDVDLEGRNVLVVEDILDTGRSLLGIRASVEAARPRRVEIAVLLDKEERREVNVAADHTGFAVPNEFLVGYGLDYAGRYRNLPYVGILSRKVYGG